MANEQNPGNEQFPLVAVYDLLAPRRRRELLYCLFLYATPMRLSDVAVLIAGWSHDGSGDESLDERLRIYDALSHRHVPKLSETEVVTYSRSDETIDLGPNASRLRPYLEQTAREDLDASEISLF